MAEQRSTIRNEMANMHRIMAALTAKNTAEIVKAMQAACDLKESDLGLLRAEHKKLKLAHTLRNTDHALLKQKQATQSGAEEYAQCQKSIRATQNLCNEKDSVIFILEEQIGLLRDAIQTQGLDFPETPRVHLHPPPLPIVWHPLSQETGLKATLKMLSQITLRILSQVLIAVRRSLILDGATPGGILSQSLTTIMTGDPRLQPPLHLHRVIIITLTPATSRHDMARTLLKKVKAKVASTTMPLSHWHREAKEVASLMKKTSVIVKCDIRRGIPTELGMPIRFNVSLHFYYLAGVQLCINAINIKVNTEMLDKTNGEGQWRIAFNVDTASVSILAYFSQLGEDDKTLRDYRIAKHYLGLQERATRIYELRRHHFYLITVVHNEKRPTHTFLDKNEKRPTHTFLDKNAHILMKRDFHRNKLLKAPATFNKTRQDKTGQDKRGRDNRNANHNPNHNPIPNPNPYPYPCTTGFLKSTSRKTSANLLNIIIEQNAPSAEALAIVI